MNLPTRRLLQILISVCILTLINHSPVGSLLLAATFWLPALAAEGLIRLISPLVFGKHC